jgi:flavin-dependent dehydrogenase
MRYDALIVGAGPAGSVVARLLAQAGWQVALVERAVFPRRKVCGEFISAASLPVLEACGVAEAFSAAAGPQVTRVGIYAGDMILTASGERVWGRALGRQHLDLLLRDAAVTAGAQLYQPMELVSLHRDASGFACRLSGVELAARTVIAACGSWNARGMFAVTSHKAVPSDLFAFKAHFTASRLPPGLMPLLAFPGGYGGLVQTDAGRTSLSCCIRRDVLAAVRARHAGKAAEAVLAHIRATTKGAREALAGAVLEGGFLSTGPIRSGMRPLQKDGVFFTGNIAGEAHPIIAEGISMAMQASALLARLLIAQRGEDYARAWRRNFAPRIRAASLFAHLAMNDAARIAALGLLGAMPGLIALGARLSGKLASALAPSASETPKPM